MNTPKSQNNSTPDGFFSKMKASFLSSRITMPQLLVGAIALWLFLTWLASSQEM